LANYRKDPAIQSKTGGPGNAQSVPMPNTSNPHSSGHGPDPRPRARGLAPLVGFPLLQDGKRRSVRLEMDWSEWFYWMGEMGPVQVTATNGWGVCCRQQRMADWCRVPGSPVWLDEYNGSEVHTDKLGALLAVEEDCRDGFCLGWQLLHRNGHEHFKINLLPQSNLQAYEEMVRQTAIPGPPLPVEEDALPGHGVEMPKLSRLWRLWRGACRTMPSETFAGLEPLARWTALQHIGEEFARPMALTHFGTLLERLAGNACGLWLTLYHPDHQSSVRFRPDEVRNCGHWWHLFGDDAQCHLRKHSELRLVCVTEEPGTWTSDWIEIYHRPSRRLLAWLRPEEDPTGRVRWRRALAGLV